MTACTYLSQKWPHLATEGEVLLRASVGRFGDERAEAWSDAEVVGAGLGRARPADGTGAGSRWSRW